MTTLVAVYMTAGAPRAMAVDVGTGGSNAEVWKAVTSSLAENDELIAVVEGARGTDAFCMVADGKGGNAYVTLAQPIEAQVPADAGLSTAQINAKAAAEAEAKALEQLVAAKPAKKSTKKGA